MKKTSLVKMLIMVALFSGLIFAAPQMRTTATNTQYFEGYDFMQMELKGSLIPPSTFISVYLDQMAGFNQVGMAITAASAGTITTANFQPLYQNGANVATAATLTAGTDITAFKSAFYRLDIYNYETASVNITANILVTK